MLDLPTLRLLPALALLAACSSLEAKRPFEGPMVLPCEEDSHYVFESGAATLVLAGGERRAFPLPGLGGRPACVAWDYLEGYGVAAYPEGLARIALEDPVAPEVLAGEGWERTPGSIGMAGGLLCALSGSGGSTAIDVRRVDDGTRVWASSLRNWMDHHGLDVVVYAVPVEPFDGDHLVLVGQARGRVVVQKVDRSRRPWIEEARTEFGELHRLQAWTTDGADVYLAGVFENMSGATHFDMGTLEQTLLVYRFDARSLTKRELLRRESDAVETRVDAISVAGDLAALTLNGKQVEVYRIGAEGLQNPPLDRPNFRDDVHAICTSEASVLITGDATPVVRRYD